MKTAAIMQPTYLPWLGYFDLMDQSDVFVLLDSVQFERRSWQQRNRIKTAQGELTLTVPVLTKGKREQRIVEVQIDDTSDFAEKHIRTLEHHYGKAPYFRPDMVALAEILRRQHRYLAELTIDLVQWLKERLGIQTELVRSSALGVEGKRTELLVAICKRVGAGRYLSPVGSRDYIEENNLFPRNGIILEYHNYQHPRYHQLHGDFLSYMSIIDLLFNEGGHSLDIIRSGRSAD